MIPIEVKYNYFLDINLLKVSTSIPKKFKIHEGREKFILREAFKNDIPFEAYQRKKRGFDVPCSFWLLEDEIYNFLKNLIIEKNHNLYNQEPLLNLLNDFKNMKDHNILSKESIFLWMIMIFELWYKIFIQNEKRIELS